MPSALIAIAVSLAIGGVAYWLTHKIDGPITVSKRELLIGTAISIGVLLIAGPVIEKLILDNKTRYYEYWNGIEQVALDTPKVCERDGSCLNSYSCDPYIVMVTYTTTDADGNTTTHTRPETRYHDCPHADVEHEYTVVSSLGTYSIARGMRDSHAKPWRPGESDLNSVPLGPPQFWLEANARIAAGKPGGVTEVHPYKNFLLASDKTILDEYSDSIERYQKAGLLPPHTTNYKKPIYSFYLADKFQAVKVKADGKVWNEYVQRLNGHLGKDLQGDVHLVAVDATKAGQADVYAQSLFAYWKSDEFGKHALPKNAIGIVLGVRGGVVEWARATGGLPVGNEGLFVDLRNNLRGVKFDPDTVVGARKGEGVLFQTLWGQNKYSRPCMECAEEGTDGYEYLKADIAVSAWQRFWFVFVCTLLSGGMWWAFLYYDDRWRNGRW